MFWSREVLEVQNPLYCRVDRYLYAHIITGIGLAIAKKFCEAGATVTVLDQDESQLEIVSKTLDGIRTISCNLGDWEGTRSKIASLGPFHHLVNNAGVARPAETLLNIKPASIDE